MLCAHGANALALAVQVKEYVPLMQWRDAGQLPVEAWATKTGTGTKVYGINSAARPHLAGLWPKDVELLVDALLRKHGPLLGNSRSKARALILRRYARSPQSVAQLRGIFAEAVYLEKHPNEGYVSKPNAKHNDVYRMDNHVPNGAQIKTKGIFSGSGYAAEMNEDYHAKRFIVPDDHVPLLKSYFLEQAQKFESAGDTRLADKSRQQFAKIRPLGETSGELENRLQLVNRRVAAEKSAPYVSLGVATGLGLAPFLWDYANDQNTAERFLNQATRDISLRVAAFGTDKILTNVKGGALRGSVKGNLITGTAMFVVDSGLLVYENGGTRTFKEAIFWEEIGGSSSALTLGFVVGAPVTIFVTELAMGMGPAAPVVGATTGFMAASLSGMVGYVGGKTVTRKLLDNIAPEIARKAEQDAVKEVRIGLDALEKKAIAWQPVTESALRTDHRFALN